jgi:ribosome-associated heat shock protein Hsp15
VKGLLKTNLETQRIDKWLWAARFFKTRALAQQAVDAGHVKWNAERVKPAKGVRVGDRLAIQIGNATWQIQIAALSEQRSAAPIARTLYDEDPASAEARTAQALLRRSVIEPAMARSGRPTKRDRRQLVRWRES